MGSSSITKSNKRKEDSVRELYGIKRPTMGNSEIKSP